MTKYFTDYDVLTEDQALGLLPEGEYNAWIRCVETRPGQKDPSKTYVVLTVDVYDDNGKPHTIMTWCALPHLLRHVCEATGHLNDFENKTLILEDHLLDKEVCAVVVTQKAKDGRKARSVIQDFKPVKKDDSLNDDIKF